MFIRKPDKKDWLSIAVVAVLMALLVFLSIYYFKTYSSIKGDNINASVDNLRELITSYGSAGILVLTLLHGFQVLISVIPANVTQFAGGVIYGFPIGIATGIIGTAAGSMLTFLISRLWGKRVVTLFVSEKNMDKLDRLFSGGTSGLRLFILYLIPGLPKDFFGYFIGLTNVSAGKFFLASTLGRLPGMIVSTFFGASAFSGNRPALITAIVITCVSFLAVYIFRGKISAVIRKLQAHEK